MKRPTDKCGKGKSKQGCDLPRSAHFDQNPEVDPSPFEHPFVEPLRMYTLLYYAGPDDTLPTRWDKSLDEFLTPNGEDPLLIWMLKTLDERSNGFMLAPTEEFAEKAEADAPLYESLDTRLENAGFDESDRMNILEAIMPALTTPGLDFPL